MSAQRTFMLPSRLLSGVLGLGLAVLGASACAGPRTLDALEQARAAVVRAENSAAGRYATDQLMESVKTLGQAETAYFEDPRGTATIDLAVRAQKQAEQAIARGEAARLEQHPAPSLSRVPMPMPATPAPKPGLEPAHPAAAPAPGSGGGMGAAMPVKPEAL